MGTLLASLFAISSVVLGPDLVHIGGRGGVEVYERKGEGLVELVASGVINAPPVEVQAALLDYGSQSRVNPRLVESRVLDSDLGELIVYQRLALPVIKDRDFTLRVRYDEEAPKGLRFTITSARGPAEGRGVVRMTTMNGEWKLEPTADGNGTRATYAVQMDFGGAVPRGMVRSGAAKDLPNLFKGIERLVELRRSGVVGGVARR